MHIFFYMERHTSLGQKVNTLTRKKVYAAPLKEKVVAMPDDQIHLTS